MCETKDKNTLEYALHFGFILYTFNIFPTVCDIKQLQRFKSDTFDYVVVCLKFWFSCFCIQSSHYRDLYMNSRNYNSDFRTQLLVCEHATLFFVFFKPHRRVTSRMGNSALTVKAAPFRSLRCTYLRHAR